MTYAEAVGAPLAEHQEAAIARIETLHGFAGVLCDPRTGKTRIALAYSKLANLRRILVICQSTYAGIWQEEAEAIDFHLPIHVIVGGSVESRAKQVNAWRALQPDCMIVLNYEGYWREPLFRSIVDWAPDGILDDECQGIKDRNSEQSKGLHKLALLPSIRARLGLTGTPVTEGLQDLFSIFKFINPEVFPRYWTHFSREYLIIGGYTGYQVVGSRNERKAKRLIAANSVQIRRSDAWGGLPKRFDQVVPVYLTEESSARYKQLKKNQVAQIIGTGIDGKPLSGQVLSRVTLTTVMRLHQLTGGHVNSDNGIIDVSSEKIDAATNITKDALDRGEQVVLFCRFKREIERLYESISEIIPDQVGRLMGGSKIHGGSTPEDRIHIRKEFAQGKLKVLICQTRVGAKGIDLSAATTGIVVSTGSSLDDFIQLRERLTGIDPNRSFTYYYLLARLADGKPTLDKIIYKTLSDKQKIAGKSITLDYALNLLQ